MWRFEKASASGQSPGCFPETGLFDHNRQLANLRNRFSKRQR
jgi:hypothetical protein